MASAGKERGRLDGPARLLLVCNSPDNGGGANLLFRITQHLNQDRVRPTVFLHKDGWQAAQQRKYGYADVVIDTDLMELDPIPWPRIDNLHLVASALWATSRRTVRAVWHMKRLAQERNIHVLAGNGAAPSVMASFAAGLADRPALWNAIRCYDDWYRPVPMQGYAYLPQVKKIFAISKAAAIPYRHMGDKVAIAYSGVDPSELDPAKLRGTLRARLGVGPDVPLVGMAGRIIELKGVDYFLRAAALLAPEFPQAKFVVIGRREGNDFDRGLDAIIQEHGLGERVFFTGWVDDIRTEMLDLDIMAVPSRRDAAPLVAYEGMSLARPIVATRCPGLDEQLEEGVSGLYVDRGDWRGLAAGIARLLRDPGLRLSMGQAARARVLERFDIRAFARKIEDATVALAENPRADV